MKQKIDIYLPTTALFHGECGGIWLKTEKENLFDIVQARMDSEDLEYADYMDVLVRFYRNKPDAETDIKQVIV